MGECAEFKVNGVCLYAMKNDSAAHPRLLEIFKREDWVSEPNEKTTKARHVFQTNCKSAISRLEVQGYNLERAFNQISLLISRYESSGHIQAELPFNDANRDYFWDEYDNPPEEVGQIVAAIADHSALFEAYKQFTSDRHLADLMRAAFYDKRLYSQFEKPVNILAEKLFANRTSWNFLLTIDPLYELRIILECQKDDCKVEYDCTDVIEYWDPNIEEKLLRGFEETSAHCETVVLTEGPTDDEFLSSALKLFEPDIAHLFKFFDYHNDYKPDQSAAALCKLGKALMAAKLRDRFILIFDNDTVGRIARNGLPKNERMPANMAAIVLPDTPLGKCYPTIGPDGESESDVNGRACAIEFFLGRDALLNSENNLRPIIWNEYHAGEYQGGFSKEDKHEIEESFRHAIIQRQSGSENFKYDWDSIKSVLQCIIKQSSLLEPIAIQRP